MTNEQENHHLTSNGEKRAPEARIITSDGQVLKVMLNEPESKRIMGAAFRRTVLVERDAALLTLGAVPSDLQPAGTTNLDPHVTLSVKVARAYKEGAELTELMQQYGLEMNRVMSFLRMHRVKLRVRKPSTADLQEMRRLYEEEMRSSIEISFILGYPEASVRVRLRKMGARMRPKGRFRSSGQL